MPDAQHEDFRGDQKPAAHPPAPGRKVDRKAGEESETAADDGAPARDIQRAFEEGLTRLPPG